LHSHCKGQRFESSQVHIVNREGERIKNIISLKVNKGGAGLEPNYMGINNKDDTSAIQPFNLDGLRNALRVFQDASHEQVFDMFHGQRQKIDSDLVQGFTTWITKDDLGSAVTYNSDQDKTWFLVKKTIINSIPVHQEVTGNYSVGGRNVSIMVDNEVNSPLVTCRVFLDDLLIANRTSPEDWASNQADAFTRNLVEGRDEDPSRLDATLRDDRSPYPFALKMLQDFQHSSPDKLRINQMFDKMKGGNGITVWHTEYQVK
jgi:hypothetical protein